MKHLKPFNENDNYPVLSNVERYGEFTNESIIPDRYKKLGFNLFLIFMFLFV